MKAHREPILFHDFWRNRIGLKEYERLKIMAYAVRKYDPKMIALDSLRFQESTGEG